MSRLILQESDIAEACRDLVRKRGFATLQGVRVTFMDEDVDHPLDHPLSCDIEVLPSSPDERITQANERAMLAEANLLATQQQLIKANAAVQTATLILSWLFWIAMSLLVGVIFLGLHVIKTNAGK